ncbi:MAG: sulfatase-like hydrolase/transferase, partial [Cyanobacteria bacterium J06641_5]
PNILDRYRQWFKRTLAGILGKTQDIFARSEWLLSLSFTPLMVPLWQAALSFKGNTAKSLADAARLLGSKGDRPTFCFINLMGTHMPYHPPRRFMERFAPHVLADKAARRYLRQFNSDIYGWLAPLAAPLSDRDKATLDGMYDAEVASQDEQLGIFFEQLRASGTLDNTLVIICADHGEHLGEKQLLGHTNALYNELTQVPLIVRDPRGQFAPGSIRPDAVSTRRIFHTALNAAGLATPAEATLDLATTDAEDTIFAQGVPPQNVINLLRQRQPELVRERACDRTSVAVWDGTYKLQTKLAEDAIEPLEETLELYDIARDPGETLNLRDILPEEVERLQEYLQGIDAKAAAERADNLDDPEVIRRLRDLGYLE